MKTQRDFEQLAGLGALGAAGGIMLAWLAFVWFVRPVPTGGIDGTSHLIVASASFLVFGLLAVVHLWLGAQLRRGPVSVRG